MNKFSNCIRLLIISVIFTLIITWWANYTAGVQFQFNHWYWHWGSLGNIG